ncbi:Chromatin complexes subunit BAP18-like Protein [Tribolium castaneum]|uniref:Chromatin complexes subunit BAP18-like Protein n=1 Tax=Tribolium castaneum TaxID=7070 RepID=A0A139WJH5_TRICA|nr:PREDICTED: chromatin complexes subunit BAP18 isoform X2 [Tribolium castaneum]KYB28109.1 Chromatin complexes subunit BAP18-like Protein [Tribolium castaneum]|eukprot:XP_008192638.1 PREDICTED: chromatin complexes subunit BAP18 isoform X2 [Tribolium castaneum]
MSSASKVGEIFTAAGQAFNRLGDLTMQLHPNVESQSGSQIRTALKKKAFEDAGLPVRQLNTVQQNVQQPMIKSEVTLNMLNAAESEVDVEGLHEEVKLEFDGANEEVSS